MPQHHSLVDLCLTEPGTLLSRRENLHCYLLTAPFTPPHFTKTPLPYALLQDDGSGYGPLNQQWQTWKEDKISCLKRQLRGKTGR